MTTKETEQNRLKTLQLYNIMDTVAEKAFDDLTRLASVICETPICLISLVDDKRQWFKSRIGLDAIETPLEQAFCAHAIQHNEIMIVEDATKDPRFADNPLVTGSPNIRFYAGAPLQVQDGTRLGTLCVIDEKSRVLTNTQLEALEILKDSIVTLLEFRKAQHDITAMEKILPMCAWCKSIEVTKGDGTTWVPLHNYVADSTTISHGICPSCRDTVTK